MFFHQFIVGAFVYHYLISVPLTQSRALHWTFVANLVLELLLSNIIQIFYAVRLWKLTSKPKLVFFAVVPLVINNLFLGIYVPVNLSEQVSNVSEINKINFRWAVITLLAGTSALDFVLSTSLIHALVRAGTQMRWATSSLQVVAAFVANTGFLASVFSVPCLIVYIIMPDNMIFIAIRIVVTKVYFASFMAMLNAHQYFQRAENAITIQKLNDITEMTTIIPRSHQIPAEPTINELGLPLFSSKQSGGSPALDSKLMEIAVQQNKVMT